MFQLGTPWRQYLQSRDSESSSASLIRRERDRECTLHLAKKTRDGIAFDILASVAAIASPNASVRLRWRQAAKQNAGFWGVAKRNSGRPLRLGCKFPISAGCRELRKPGSDARSTGPARSYTLKRVMESRNVGLELRDPHVARDMNAWHCEFGIRVFCTVCKCA